MNHLRLLLIGVAMSAASGLASADVNLSPTFAGPAAAGTGANATFIAIDGNWQGSTVLWNESTRT